MLLLDSYVDLVRRHGQCGSIALTSLERVQNQVKDLWLATIAFGLWNKVLWRLAAIQRFEKVPPDARGTWKGTLSSSWVDPTTGKNPEPITTFLVVRQTASAVKVIQLTDESKSVSSLATVTNAPGQCSLDYLFLNQPQSRVEHRSRMHHGSAALDISGHPATRLRGRYWTDRDTRGEVDFRERRLTVVENFDEAVQLFEKA